MPCVGKRKNNGKDNNYEGEHNHGNDNTRENTTMVTHGNDNTRRDKTAFQN